MTTKTIVAALALVMAATPALAQKPHKRAVERTQAGCVNNWQQRPLLDMLFSTGPAPQANGCAPAVHSNGQFVGQDPDERIRAELRRNPDGEGYHYARP